MQHDLEKILGGQRPLWGRDVEVSDKLKEF